MPQQSAFSATGGGRKICLATKPCSGRFPFFHLSVTLTPASRVYPAQRSESAQTSSGSKRPVDLHQRRGIFLPGYAFSASTKSLPHGQRDDTSAVSRLHGRG